MSAVHKSRGAHRAQRTNPVPVARLVEVPVDPVQKIQSAVSPARANVSAAPKLGTCAAATDAPQEEHVMPCQVIHIPRVLQHHLRRRTSGRGQVSAHAMN